MSEECIDDTITRNAYTRMASGTYFASMSTPDVYTLFTKELAREYESQGMSAEEAQSLAEENIVMAPIPALPAGGDLEEEDPELIPCKMMGGVNGYAISSYTEAPNACLAFVDFAAGYDSVARRNELLGIVPAREDVASNAGSLGETMFRNMEEGNIIIMPSIEESAQIWTPAETFFSDIAKDPYRSEGKKYNTLEEMKAGLEAVDQQIYDSIFTLKEQVNP